MSSLSSSFSSTSSAGSAFGDADRETSESPLDLPSPHAIGAALDEYVCAAKVGRAAFACGDLKTAVEQFDQALDIELQTEMECMYDASLGFVSGLVRREVDNRLQSSPRRTAGPPPCDSVLDELARVYKYAEKQSESKPTDPKWYLRMGATLCMVNEWEKAKKIYVEGLNTCKDRKELKKAFRNLAKIQKITSGDISADELSSSATVFESVSSATAPAKAKVGWRPKFGTISVVTSKRQERPKSDYIEYPPVIERRSRLGSLGGGRKPRTMSDPPSPNSVPRAKRFSFGSGTLKPSNLLGFSSKQSPSIDYEERVAWVEAFSSESSVVSKNQEFKSSAIVQMRRLSFEIQSPRNSFDSNDEELQVCELRPTYTAVNPVQSLYIDGDEDEIEDY